MLKTILFDFDHTLFNLNVRWRDLIKRICSACFGCKYSHLNVYDFLVMYHNIMRHRLPKKLTERVDRERVKYELEGIERGYPVPGSREIVLKLADKYKLGLVSSNCRATIREGLKSLGLKGAFKVIICVDDVRYSKPNKLPVLAALKKLSCTPDEAVYVGDHPGDVECAKSAGVKSVILLGRRTAADFEQKPDIFITRLSELPEVLKRLETV